jgi:peptidoglycan/xylan/chitin deacetylase (PgdA/CDA1 family)
MSRPSLGAQSLALCGVALGALLLATPASAQDGAPVQLGNPPAPLKPVQKPATAVAPKPATAQTPAAAAKPATAPGAAKPAGAQAAKPAAPAAAAAAKPKPAPDQSAEAKRAARFASQTGQTTVPKHDHVFETVAPTACPGNPDAIGVSRVMKVDTDGGYYVGTTYSTRLPLEPKEVVLTFDDGPMTGRTERVLSALDKECTKATFFIVGQMAKAYPETLRKTAAAGHTIAYHTMTHPLNMVKWPLAKAQENIQTGWQVVDQILYGQSGEKPATPFFRYPGLFNSRAINEWFNRLNMGVWTIDAAGNDWLKGYITLNDGPNVMREALKELEARNGGILLLHDIKDSSSSIVGPLLRELKARGYKIVHIVPKNPPPKLVTGPIEGHIPTIAETTVPVQQRALTGYDVQKQLAQTAAGRQGTTPGQALPAYDAAKTAVPAPVTSEPATTGSIPAPVVAQPKAEEGWFSSTASSFRGIGSAVGLW